MKPLARLMLLGLAAVLLFWVALLLFQRKLLYFPTHHTETHGLTPWQINGQLVGYARLVAHPQNIWLLTHGNGGQAADRSYALPCFSPHDTVYILEYPGYGSRAGSPGKQSFDAAATQAYWWLRRTYPALPVCVAGESIGSGPAALLAQQSLPPDKIALVVPFDSLVNVAQEHYPWLPVRLLLQDRWDNSAALRGYRGQVEIFGAVDDRIIPLAHARALAASVPRAVFHVVPGGHNDWSQGGAVRLRNP